jgi:hypothetical protein
MQRAIGIKRHDIVAQTKSIDAGKRPICGQHTSIGKKTTGRTPRTCTSSSLSSSLLLPQTRALQYLT